MNQVDVYRSTNWRVRLDNTTNWTVVSSGIGISASFSSEITIGSQPSRDYIWADGKLYWVTYLHTDGMGAPRICTDVLQRRLSGTRSTENDGSMPRLSSSVCAGTSATASPTATWSR